MNAALERGFEVVGVVWSVGLCLLMILVAVGLTHDAVAVVKRRRARARFSREALRLAKQRLAAHHAQTVAERAENDRLWAEIVAFPEWSGP